MKFIDNTAFDHSFLPVLEKAFRQFAASRFLYFKRQSYTYADVDTRSRQIANTLARSGFHPGMHGAVYSLNSAQSLMATIGVIRAGGVWVPINPRNSAATNDKLLQQLGCEAVFFERRFESAVSSLGAKIFVCLDGNSSSSAGEPIETWVGDDASHMQVARKGSDLLMLPSTGGTTGAPKGVMLSHRNFRAIDYGMRLRYEDRTPVVLGAAPMTHVGGRIALASMSSGASIVVLDHVDPELVLRTVEEHGVTDFFLPPTALYALLDQPRIKHFDLSSLRAVSYGSAPISIPRLKQALSTFGPVMEGGYGQTECPMFITRLTQSEHIVKGEIAPDSRLRSVGRSTAISEVAIIGESGDILPPHSRGEIVVRGPMVCEGYYRDPEETAKIRLGQWHLTGDIGYLDDEGYLYIVDRKKDMIITGGFNVYSTEVEQVLLSIPGVADAAVVGVPSEKWGEEVCAVIQTKRGHTLSTQTIVNACKAALGSVKSPKSVVFTDELPRTPIGKIDKKSLKLNIAQG